MKFGGRFALVLMLAFVFSGMPVTRGIDCYGARQMVTVTETVAGVYSSSTE